MKTKIYVLMMVLTCLVLPLTRAGIARAFTVFDPSNFLVNVMQEFRNLMSNLNEARMIANQARQIAMQVKNLEKINFDILEDFNSEFEGLFSELGTLDGLISNLETLSEKYEEVYPLFEDAGSVPSPVEFQEKVAQMRRETRGMIEDSLRVGAKVREGLPQTKAQFDRLMAESQGSVGILQATQAGNQLMGAIGGQLMNLTAMAAEFQQAQAAYMAEEGSIRAAQRARDNQLMDGWDAQGPIVQLRGQSVR